MLPEEISEFQKLFRVSGKAGELGKNEAGDVTACDVGKHPFGFGVLHDGFAGHASQVIHLNHRPIVELGVFAGAGFVMLRAFSLGLVLGRNPNPDAHSFFQGAIFLHTLLHTRKRMPIARKKCSLITYICYGFYMSRPTTMCENDLAVLAKTFRRQASTTRAQAARDMKVSQTSIFNAEETPDQSLVKLRMRMIETYSKFKVTGPVYLLEEK